MTITSFESGRIQGLDVIRFFAISLVIGLHAGEMSHTTHPIGDFLRIGWIGVDLFFVLSGYLIGSQVFNGKDETGVSALKHFWAKRWWRTFPLYFVVLFTYVLVKPLLGFPFQDSVPKFLFFLQNVGEIGDFTQSWSICIEEHFYIIFPILVFILGLKNKSPFVWLGFTLLSMLLRAYLLWSGKIQHTVEGIDFGLRFVTIYHLDGISMGVFLASTRHAWRAYPKLPRRCAGVFGIVLALYFSLTTPYVLTGTSAIWLFTVLAIGFSLVVIGFHDLQVHRYLYLPLQKVALWSYGIYLWNGLVMRVFDKLHLNLNAFAYMALFYVVSVAVAVPTYYVVEVPFLKLRDRFLEKRRKLSLV